MKSRKQGTVPRDPNVACGSSNPEDRDMNWDIVHSKRAASVLSEGCGRILLSVCEVLFTIFTIRKRPSTPHDVT